MREMLWMTAPGRRASSEPRDLCQQRSCKESSNPKGSLCSYCLLPGPSPVQNPDCGNEKLRDWLQEGRNPACLQPDILEKLEQEGEGVRASHGIVCRFSLHFLL